MSGWSKEAASDFQFSGVLDLVPSVAVRLKKTAASVMENFQFSEAYLNGLKLLVAEFVWGE